LSFPLDFSCTFGEIETESLEVLKEEKEAERYLLKLSGIYLGMLSGAFAAYVECIAP
jgi:hypothetical protein